MKSFREMMPEVLKNIEWNRIRREIFRDPEFTHAKTFAAARKYPDRFIKDLDLTKHMFKFLDEPKYFDETLESFCYLAEKNPTHVLWELHNVKVLHKLASSESSLLRSEASRFAVEVINSYGSQIPIEDNWMTFSNFARSPFAVVLLEALPTDVHNEIFQAVKNIISTNDLLHEAVQEVWTHDFFELARETGGHFYGDYELLKDARSLIDPEQLVPGKYDFRDDVLKAAGAFTPTADQAFKAGDPVTLEW